MGTAGRLVYYNPHMKNAARVLSPSAMLVASLANRRTTFSADARDRTLSSARPATTHSRCANFTNHHHVGGKLCVPLPPCVLKVPIACTGVHESAFLAHQQQRKREEGISSSPYFMFPTNASLHALPTYFDRRRHVTCFGGEGWRRQRNGVCRLKHPFIRWLTSLVGNARFSHAVVVQKIPACFSALEINSSARRGSFVFSPPCCPLAACCHSPARVSTSYRHLVFSPYFVAVGDDRPTFSNSLVQGEKR